MRDQELITYADEPILLSGIQHFVFCRRQWALIHVESQWLENDLTASGRLVHERVHDRTQTESRGDELIVLITCDVKTDTSAGKKRLSRIAKICCDYGQRVQNSVFECDLDPTQLVIVRSKLRDAMNESEDSLRFYFLGSKYEKKIEHYGCKESFDPGGVLIL